VTGSLKSTARVLFTIVLALGIGAVIIQLSNGNAREAYEVLFNSAFGNERALANTLLAATPLIFTGLATLVAFRAGIFNIGVEGSLYLGAFAAAWVGFTFTDLPGVVLIPLALIAAGLVGGAWSLIPGFLKARLRVDEVVSTIMLNYVAIIFTDYLVTGPFMAPGMSNAMSQEVAVQAQLPRLVERSQFNVAFLVALGVFVIVLIMMRRSTFGFEIRLLGSNPTFARWSGLPVGKIVLMVFFVSGFIGGLAGWGQALGVHYRFASGFSRGFGFDGIVIALLGRNSPMGVLLAALFFGALRSGSSTMEMFTNVPRDLIDIMIAVIIFTVAIDIGFGWLKKRRVRTEAPTSQAAQPAA
jgi:simple sugar transport system permease protein